MCTQAGSGRSGSAAPYLVSIPESSVGPVFQLEALHSFELTGVVGNQCGVNGQRVAGDPQVIGPDRRPNCA